MDLDVPIGWALLAGVISFLSPCVLPLVPPYLCFITGTSLEELVDHHAAPATTIGAIRCTFEEDGGPCIRLTALDDFVAATRLTHPVLLDVGVPVDGIYTVLGYGLSFAQQLLVSICRPARAPPRHRLLLRAVRR